MHFRAWVVLLLALASSVAGCSRPDVDPAPDPRTECYEAADPEACQRYLASMLKADLADRLGLEIVDMVRERPDAWQPYYLYGLHNYQARRYAEAADALRQGSQKAEAAGDVLAEYENLYLWGLSISMLGDEDRALETLEQATSLGERLGRADLQRRALHRIARIHYRAERYLDHKQVLDRMAPLFTPETDLPSSRVYWFETALNRRRLGRVDEVEQALAPMLRDVDSHDDHASYWEARSAIQLAVAELDRNRPDVALELIERGKAAVARSTEAQRKHVGLIARSVEGFARFRAGQLDRAKRIIEEGLREADELDDPYHRVVNSVNLAQVERKMGLLDEAETHFRRAIELSEASQEPEQAWDAWAGLAALELRRGRSRPAIDAAREAVKRVETMRGDIGDMTERTHFLQARADTYRVLAQALAARGVAGGAEAFGVSDRVHARTLVEMLSSSRSIELGAAAFDLDAIQRALGRRGAIVEFLMGEEVSLRFLVERDRVEVATLPPRSEIERSVQRYLAILRRPLRSLDARLDPEGDFLRSIDDGRRLYDLLFGGIEDRIGTGGRLFVVPDRRLHELPFEALPVGPAGNPANVTFLGQTTAVTYLPSASFLTKETTAEPGSILLVAAGEASKELDLPPLDHADREIDAVAGRYPAGSRLVLRDTEATLSAVERSIGDGYPTLHVTAHALLEPGVGPRIVLAPDASGKPGFLDAERLARLPSVPRLVVLSACETARGELVGGEGILGLVRAFTLAGAEQIVASLWQVDDEATATLMGAFHRELQAGRRPSAALQAARTEMLADGFVHPYLWSGFVLYGAD